MFRKVISSLTRLVKPATKVVKPISEQDKLTLDLYNKLQGNGNRSSEKVQAYMAYREALNELKTEKLTEPDLAAASSFIKSTELDPETLPIVDLLNLATASFTGLKSTNEQLSIARDVDKAISLWKVAANRGSLEASYRLASCHRTGEGLEKDSEKALKMYQELAAKDYPEAHYALATMYKNGEDHVKADPVKAFEHYYSAVRLCVSPAVQNLANCYAEGLGTEKNEKKALLLYETAAEVGDHFAMFTLANWYATGRVVEKDLERAHFFNMRAAELGHSAAMFNVGCSYMSGTGVSRDPTLAAEWFQRAIDRGFVRAAVNLAGMHRDGFGVPKDLLKAREILERFAEVDEECRDAVKAIDDLMTLSNPKASQLSES